MLLFSQVCRKIIVLLCFVLYMEMFFRVNLRQGKINDAEPRIKLIHNQLKKHKFMTKSMRFKPF